MRCLACAWAKLKIVVLAGGVTAFADDVRVRLNKVVFLDWDETISRVSVCNDFSSRSPDARFNCPADVVNMMVQGSTYKGLIDQYKITPRPLNDHMWYEFCGVYDGVEIELPPVNQDFTHTNASFGMSVRDSKPLILPSRVLKLKAFLQRLADEGNIAVYVLSNTRLGPESIVAKLTLLGLDHFFDGAFAVVRMSYRQTLEFLRNDGDGEWSSFSLGKYDDDKIGFMEEFVSHPGDYLGNRFDGLQTSSSFIGTGQQLSPQDVLLIDDMVQTCRRAQAAGFKSYLVKRTSALKPASMRGTAGFGAGPDFERDLGCYDGSPLDLLRLCSDQPDDVDVRYV
eukprot:TRINITY_DN19542_c1_g2_i1.p1 TRINITY_DN19542_c1_g2~~TRINITY_DN19542_c1_g2_i1.p1  ORF type:complete len:339 (-),score=41.82 TRINITY_DN19542_c1_g2_i1:160-1176(-)